jgi:hypothetical protein
MWRRLSSRRWPRTKYPARKTLISKSHEARLMAFILAKFSRNNYRELPRRQVVCLQAFVKLVIFDMEIVVEGS